MLRLRVCFLGLLLVAFGAGCTSPAPPAPVASPRTPDEQKAMDLARTYLDKQGMKWGAPKAVTPQAPAGTFTLTYPTPEDEVKVLGERELTVDVKAGEVKPVPRK
jgi:hypothetical protein